MLVLSKIKEEKIPYDEYTLWDVIGFVVDDDTICFLDAEQESVMWLNSNGVLHIHPNVNFDMTIREYLDDNTCTELGDPIMRCTAIFENNDDYTITVAYKTKE